MPVPINYPLVGKDAFRTATGVHAAAIIKAKKKGDDWLADRVYSGVPAGMVGREQEIEVGFMSGASNVSWWLARRGITADAALVQQILQAAKDRDRILTDDEILSAMRSRACRRRGREGKSLDVAHSALGGLGGEAAKPREAPQCGAPDPLRRA